MKNNITKNATILNGYLHFNTYFKIQIIYTSIMKRNQIIAIGLLVVLGLFTFGGLFTKSCSTAKTSSSTTATVNQTAQDPASFKKIPGFSEDSAYGFIERQVAFGPRVPGTAAHQKCSNWLQTKLKSYGAVVSIQPFVGEAYDGVKRQSHNIIAQLNPKATRRILLSAHWDSRPLADQDPSNKKGAIDGAIDGASGVAVALEIARGIKNLPLSDSLGLDIIFFDNEDNGTPDNITQKEPNKNYWCLGSQYWAANLQPAGYTAYYGILLDMVGGTNTHFKREGYSQQFASSVVDNVWGTAATLGYAGFFKHDIGGPINDDHVPVNEVAHIPMIDIIASEGDSFGKFWHTHADNMKSVSRPHLKAVGHTVMQVIYNEQ
jgi:glutaminyl-peptide cyclotransferase